MNIFLNEEAYHLALGAMQEVLALLSERLVALGHEVVGSLQAI